MTGAYRVEVVMSIDALDRYRAAYVELLSHLSDGRGLFYSFDWLQAMHPVYCLPPKSMLFLLAFDQQELVGVAPLFVEQLPWKRGGIRRASCWGALQESLMVEGDFLIPDPDDVDACLEAFKSYLFREMRPAIDCLDLRYFRGESNSKVALTRIFPRTLIEREPMESYQVRLSMPFDEYLATRSKNLVKQLAKTERALSRDYGYEFQVTPVLDKATLEEIAVLHAGRQGELTEIGRSRTSLFDDPLTANCYQTLLENLSAVGMARFYVLRVAGKVMAFAICFQFGGALFGHMTSFDSRFSKYSPGRLICLKVLETEAALGVNRMMDMMPGKTKVKTDFCDVVRPRWRIIAINFHSPLAMVKMAAWRAAILASLQLKRLKDALRRPRVEGRPSAPADV